MRQTPPDLNVLLRTRANYGEKLAQKLGGTTKSGILFILMYILKEGVAPESATKDDYIYTITRGEVDMCLARNGVGRELERKTNCCPGDIGKAWHFLLNNGYLIQQPDERFKADENKFIELFRDVDFEP